jgi:photosystem II stability/assembly factor-like uncharacterized protein
MPETNVTDPVYTLAASESFLTDGVCFAARPSGLYRSADGGRSWTSAYALSEISGPLPTFALVLSSAFPQDATVMAGVAGGILRSGDGGEHWQIARVPSPPPVVTALAVSPDFPNDGVALAGTMEDGVLFSNDRGWNWATWNFGLLDLHILCLAMSSEFARDETVFAGTEIGIFRSTNGGRAWREVDFPTDRAPVLSLALSPRFASDGVLYAGTETYGLWRSADRGRTWERLGGRWIRAAVNQVLLAHDSSGDPARPDVLVAANGRLRVTRDGGRTWLPWESGTAPEGDITAVAAPAGIAAGTPLLIGTANGRVVRV